MAHWTGKRSPGLSRKRFLHREENVFRDVFLKFLLKNYGWEEKN